VCVCVCVCVCVRVGANEQRTPTSKVLADAEMASGQKRHLGQAARRVRAVAHRLCEGAVRDDVQHLRARSRSLSVTKRGRTHTRTNTHILSCLHGIGEESVGAVDPELVARDQRADEKAAIVVGAVVLHRLHVCVGREEKCGCEKLRLEKLNSMALQLAEGLTHEPQCQGRKERS
jgi:hypothetical protein